ncbi:MAG: ROK family protein [Bacteroidales bacterium]
MEKLLCGVDIGGTKLSTALITLEGIIIDNIFDYDHVEKSEDELVEQIVGNIKKLLINNNLNETDLYGIGVGCAGHIRFRDGVIITTSNLKGFKNYPLRKAIKKHFSIPVILDNDANAQAFGEWVFGGYRDYDSLIFLTVSSGIGAGIILNHRLYRGFTGTAGEFGHTIVNPESDLKCTCGNYGCLMSCACGMALPHLFRKKIEAGKHSILNIENDFDYSKIDGKFLKQGLEAGDPVSREIILESAYYVGIGIYNIFQALNPPLVVLGGGLLSWGEIYTDKIKKTFYELARDMIFDPIRIETSGLGNDAGILGAASLVLEVC